MTGALSLGVLVLAASCNREGPRVAAIDGGRDMGPSAEEFCAQVDRLSADDLEDASDDERRAAHAVCVKASTEDREKYPEWAPCARCMMDVSTMDGFDTLCKETCAALEAKLQEGDAAG